MTTSDDRCSKNICLHINVIFVHRNVNPNTNGNKNAYELKRKKKPPDYGRCRNALVTNSRNATPSEQDVLRKRLNASGGKKKPQRQRRERKQKACSSMPASARCHRRNTFWRSRRNGRDRNSNTCSGIVLQRQ